mgnify:CR=1 FL=1
MSAKPRALITGIRGFTGKYLAEELEARGYEVWGTSQGVEDESSRVRQVDLRNYSEIREFAEKVNPSVVVHLAAISFVAHGDVAEIYEMNVVGTRNLLAALTNLPSRPRSVILASSANIYGNSIDDPITEESSLDPLNDYAVSKLAMEKMAKLWMGELPITIVRPFNYSGVGQSLNFLIPKLVEHFVQEKPSVNLGNLDVYRDFSDVRTVIWAYAQLVENPAPGEIFNIASGHLTSISELISMLERLARRPIEVISSEEFGRKGEVSKLRGDSTKLWAHIGKPKALTLEETLRWMLDSSK